MSFADHFSDHAAAYARFRPDYPPALYAYLAGLAPARDRAWDCGTGNGQAALALASQFADVIATDPAFNQVAQARAAAKVHYAVAAAEAAPLADASVDLVTVAQALHWFDLPRFHGEAQRVLRPRGVLAAWGYGLTRVASAVDALVDRYYRDIVGPYWPPQRRFIEDGYRSLAFPFETIEPPAFAMEHRWRVAEFAGYLRTWSAAQRYQRERGQDPLELIYPELERAWGGAEREQRVVWPLFLRVGRRDASLRPRG